MKEAAVSFIRREDGMVLCVWNRNYNGWALPGGKREESDESIRQTHDRELKEETGLETLGAQLLYTAKSCTSDRLVTVFRPYTKGVPKMMEDGSFVEWKSLKDLIQDSPFKEFYLEMIEVICERT